MTIPAVTFLQSPYQNARDSRFALRGFVEHRIVGTLPSARRAFGLVAGDPGRSASSHFGLGFVNGVLTIDQYVPLDRMAWTNGDVRDPTWSRIIAGVNPNLYTVTFEHEDGGAAGLGKIAEAVWNATMELQALLTSGNAAAIRAKGIRGATDAMVAQMRAVPKDATGFIDHHQIAGPNKPFCLRRWMEDPGLVEGSPSRRDRLLAVVRGGAIAGGGEVAMILRPARQSWKTGTGDTVAASTTVAPGGQFWTAGPGLGERKFFTTAETVTSIAESADGKWRLLLYGAELLWMHRNNLRPIAGTRIPTTGFGLTFTGGDTAAAAKAAAGAVKTAASTAAAKFGA